MRFTRLISAISLVAAVTVLGSCGQSSAPTAPSTTDPSLALGMRDYTIAPNPVNWTKQPADPIPTDTRVVLISGLIAAASYPLFGTPVYSDANQAWLDINTAPNFSRNPIGWYVTFKLKPSAQSLPIGSYTATIPVNIPGATNNPQNIVVTFNNCSNCLWLGDSRLVTLTGSEPTYDWYDINYYHTGSPYTRSYFKDWRVFLRPGETMYVQLWGGCYAPYGGNICDPAETLYDGNDPTFTGITYNDDCNGLSSQIGPITNSGATTHEYRVRTGTYGTLVTGTETIYISPTNYCGYYGGELRAPVADSIQAIFDMKAKLPLGH